MICATGSGREASVFVCTSCFRMWQRVKKEERQMDSDTVNQTVESLDCEVPAIVPVLPLKSTVLFPSQEKGDRK